jgi:predicted amidohydrolase YtcJ
MNSSYELHQDQSTGSLEVGKLADQIADIKVLQTVVGGQVVVSPK